MSTSLVRRFAATAALGAVVLAFPAAASATISGGCTGQGHSSSGSANLTSDAEWHLLSTDTGGGSGTAPAKIHAASVSAYALGMGIPIASGTSDEGKTEGAVDGVKVSTFALLGKRFTMGGSATGDAACSGQITIIFDDVNPLLTAFGGGGLALALIGALAVMLSLRGGRGLGKRFVTALFGALCGIGAALALEQFGMIDPTQIVGLLIAVVAALLGFLLSGSLGGRGSEASAPGDVGTDSVNKQRLGDLLTDQFSGPTTPSVPPEGTDSSESGMR